MADTAWREIKIPFEHVKFHELIRKPSGDVK